MSSEAPETEKQKTIAQAAFHVFAAHGFRATSMQMIATRAGMSRPALYLHFQNKEAVFRFLTERYFKAAAAEAEHIFSQDLAVTQVLEQLFASFDPDGMMAILLDAEHGHDMLDAKASIAKDIVATGVAVIQTRLAEWLARQAAMGRVTCADPTVTADTILSAYFGLKSPPPSYRSYLARVTQLADLLGKGLQA